MNLKNLNKAAAILEEVKLLDEEIIKIENFAQRVSEGELLSSLTLSFKEHSSVTTKEIDESHMDGFRYSYLRAMEERIGLGFLKSCSKENQEAEEEKMKLKYKEISDSLMLEFLALVLHHKNEYRKSLLQKIANLGVQI